MIKSQRNQLGNATNPFQGDAVKALCICSAGLLRSPSIAKFLTEKGYNTRACGMAEDYALIPLSEALLHWCDEIHVVAEQEQAVIDACNEFRDTFKVDFNKPLYNYEIADNYGTFSDALMMEIAAEFSARKGIVSRRRV